MARGNSVIIFGQHNNILPDWCKGLAFAHTFLYSMSVLFSREESILFFVFRISLRNFISMIRVLFVCHGNICRSPMAEFVLKDMVIQAGISDQFFIASAATSTEEIGNPVYPLAKRILAQHGISCEGKTARQIRKSDYAQYDIIIGMDDANMRNMRHAFGGDPENKLHLMMDYTNRKGSSVADPWYTGDFQATWRDVSDGCRGLLLSLGFASC